MVTLTGNFKYQDSTPVAHGVLVLTLSQPATISGTGQVAPLEQKIQLDANGAIPAGTTVYGNDALTPSGTVYIAALATGSPLPDGTYVFGAQLSSESWSITGTSLDVSTLTPTAANVSYPAVVSSIVVPAEFSESTASGVATISKANQSANQVWAGPSSGAAAQPGFRALVAADIPSLSYLPSSTVLPANEPAVAHDFLTAYNSSTGAFTQAQPASTDLSDVSSLEKTANKGAVSGYCGLDASALVALANLPAIVNITGVVFNTNYSNSTTSYTDVASLTLTTLASSTVYLLFVGPASATTANGALTTNLDGVDNAAAQSVVPTTYGGANITLLAAYSGLSAASHTFKIRGKAGSSGTLTLNGLGVANGYFLAVEFRK